MTVDLKERVALEIAGYANLIGRGKKGWLLAGDGEQTCYLEAGANGLVLTADSTALEGFSWQPGGGGGALTFSNGVTKLLSDVTNDLVTGATVAQVHAVATGGITLNAGTGATLTAAGNISIQSTFSGPGDGIALASANGAGIDIFQGGTGTVKVHGANAASTVEVSRDDGPRLRITTANGNVEVISKAGTGSMLVASGAASLYSAGTSMTLAAVNNVAASSSAGDVTLTATGGEVTADAINVVCRPTSQFFAGFLAAGKSRIQIFNAGAAEGANICTTPSQPLGFHGLTPIPQQSIGTLAGGATLTDVINKINEMMNLHFLKGLWVST